MVWTAAIGAAIGALAGKKKKKPPIRASLAQKRADPKIGDSSKSLPRNWLQAADKLGYGGGGGEAQNFWKDMIENFSGSPVEMQKTLDYMKPFITAQLYGTQGYQGLQDPENWDQSAQAYAGGAGQIGQAATQAQTAGSRSLARMGLGRSAAQAGLAQQAQAQAGTQQASLFTNLYQQSWQNRLAGMQRSFDIDQDIARMALGMVPQPRAEQRTESMWPAVIASLGSAAGSAIGSYGGGGGKT